MAGCESLSRSGGFPVWLRVDAVRLLALLFTLIFTPPVQARVSPAPAGKPAPSPTFGIGAGDSVFAGGGRYRVVYDWRGDHRFRLISVTSSRLGSLPRASAAAPPNPCPSPVIDSGSAGLVAEYGGVCTIVATSNLYAVSGGLGIGANPPHALLEVNGNAAFDADVGIGTTSPSFLLDVRGTSAPQAQVTNTSTSSPSIAYLSASGNNGGTVAVLGADGFGTGPLGTASGFFGTSTNQPAGIITDDVERMRVTNGGNVGIGTTSPSAQLEVNGTAKFDGAVTFTSSADGAVGNPSAMAYHMDGVKYTSLDNLITQLPANGAYTIYDDCPGGSETVSHDPFHPSDGVTTRRLLIISAPCLYTFNVPPVEVSGDQWVGAPGGYNSVQQQSPTLAGTVFKMGPDMNGQITTLPAAPTATYVSCGSTSLTTGHYYWIALTATSAVGETPLVSGNRTQASWTLPSNEAAPANSCIHYNTGSFSTPNQQGVGVYMLDGGTNSTFPASQDSSFQTYQTTANTYFNITSFTSGNPPPDVNTTQFLAGIGTCLNGAANIITHAYYRGITFDVSGGAIGVANCDGQDPPSGIEDDTFLNCTGDACYLAEGYDGNLGANGSSIKNIFVVPSTCGANPGGTYTGAIGGGCAGGLDNGPSGPGTISVSGTSVTGTGTSFATDGTLANAIISINGSVSTCATQPCEISSVTNSHSLTLASNFTGSCPVSCNYAIAGSTDQNSTTWPTYGVHLDRVAQFKSLINFDFGGDNCGSASTSCNTTAVVKADGAAVNTYASKAEILDVHGEGSVSNATINAGVELNGLPALVCGVHTSIEFVYSVQIDSGSTADTLCDLVPYSSKKALNDEVNSPTIQPGVPVGLYAIGTATGNVAGSDVIVPVSLGGNGVGPPLKNNSFHNCPTSGACTYLPSVQSITLTSQHTAGSSPTDVGWDWTLDPSAVYRLNCQIVYGASSGGGLYVEATDTNQSSDNLKLLNFAQASTNGVASAATSSLSALIGTTLGANASNYFANVSGYIHTDSTTGAHPFSILVAGTSTVSVTVTAGSWCVVQ